MPRLDAAVAAHRREIITLVRRCVLASGVTQDALGAAAGVSGARVGTVLHPDSTEPVSLELYAAAVRFGGEHGRRLAVEMGALLQLEPEPARAPVTLTVIGGAGEVMREAGEAVATVARVSADGHLSTADIAEVTAEAADVVAAGRRLLAAAGGRR